MAWQRQCLSPRSDRQRTHCRRIRAEVDALPTRARVFGPGFGTEDRYIQLQKGVSTEYGQKMVLHDRRFTVYDSGAAKDSESQSNEQSTVHD
jgi:hypothetical protein